MTPSQSSGFQENAGQEIPCINRAQMFFTIFTTGFHLFLSWFRYMQSMPSHPVALIRGITSFCLCPGLLCGLSPSGFLTKTLYVFLFSPICATCPTYLFDMFDNIMLGERYNSWSSSYTVFFPCLCYILLGLCSQMSSGYFLLSIWERPSSMTI